MSFWILLQVIVDIVLLAGVVAVWFRLHRPQKDDPRLSRGLQLLQSKISVLEDLGDRTETQVTQLTALMENKVKEIQQHILTADKQIQKIESSRDKSMEVAKIFQDRIPHQEIIERQNTIKYVKAARLAHQGMSADEIASQVDLSKGEIDFIAKVNRNNLQFSEEALPEWAKDESANEAMTVAAPKEMPPQPVAQPLPKEQDRMSLSDLGEKFRMAMQSRNQEIIEAPQPVVLPELKPIVPAATAAAPAFETAQNSKGQKVQVKKVVFPRVESDENA